MPCCICGSVAGEPIAVGEDFEYRTSPDSFLAVAGCCHNVPLGVDEEDVLNGPMPRFMIIGVQEGDALGGVSSIGACAHGDA